MMEYYEIDDACESCGHDCTKCKAKDECENCSVDYDELLNGLDEW